MRYYIISGEASGDLHGSNLMKGIKQVDNQAEFRFWGGDLMAAEAPGLVRHYNETNFMGFAEVLANLRKVKANLDFCKRDIQQWEADVVILIDYPGFNLRIAEFAKSKGMLVYYYISPKIWAWKESRIKKIKAYVDRMFVIFPFEVDYFKQHNYPVIFAGNPTIDAIEEVMHQDDDFSSFIRRNNLDNKPIVALMPGSRKQEVDRHMEIMLRVHKHFPDYQFVIAAAPSLPPAYYDKFTRYEKVHMIYGNSYEVLKYAKAALVTSGTATLETALFRVPQVVCYKTSPISYLIAKAFVKIKWISLVNLIMNREVVKELIQGEMSEPKLVEELNELLHNTDSRNQMLLEYDALKEHLGGSGASERVAREMHLKLLSDLASIREG